MDGDGYEDIVVPMSGLVSEFEACGFAGSLICSFELNLNPRHPVMGDVDGDGMAELLNYEFHKLAVYGRGQQMTEIDGWPDGYEPTDCYDLDGDGVDEVLACHSALADLDLYDPGTARIKEESYPFGLDEREREAWIEEMRAPRGGYFNVKTKRFVEFEFPETNYAQNVFSGCLGELVCGDPDGDGEVAVYAMPSLGSLLLAFNPRGELIYYEEFGEGALSISLARQRGRDHLVAQLGERVLVWP